MAPIVVLAKGITLVMNATNTASVMGGRTAMGFC
ncbi:hypothetical protein PR003_g33067 [Phytophthora rubi]|uniref:Uncharacterized protein n=1 Tax=Phytophthora rubi TaxID=129364 RepID=A0A6A4AXU6_9STRA|nr:hypothetical protein PR003_g33067 [Phytophthora rubi]